MTYPKTLEASCEKELWDYDDIFSKGEMEYVKAYYQELEASYDMHSHKGFYEISIIMEGECMHYIAKSRCLAKPGSCFVLPAGIMHGYFPKDKVKLLNVLVAQNFFERYAYELNSFTGFELLFVTEPALRGEMSVDLFLTLDKDQLSEVKKQIEKLMEYDKTYVTDGRQSMKNAKMLEIIGLLSKKMSQRKSVRPKVKNDLYTVSIIDSMEYIRKNLSLNLSALKLGKLYNMSESTFARHFYKLCSQTPYEYIMNLRIEKSKQLLSDGKLTMSAIANECGFYDGAHFTRCFEKYTKKKPSEYKNIK